MKNHLFAVLFALLFTVSPLRAVEIRHAAPGEYGPIPVKVINEMFAEHGFTPEQRKLFVVIRLVPFELGGTNARKNLMLVSHADAKDHQIIQAMLMTMAKGGRTTYAKAADQLAEWRPGQTTAPKP